MAEGQVLLGLACILLMGLLVLLLPVASSPPRRRPAAGRRASRRARTAHKRASGASPRDTPDAATLLDLTAAMLRAGVGIEPAVHRISEDVPGCAPLGRVHRRLVAGQPWRQAWSCVDSQPQLREFGEELAFAHATGAPTVELLELTALQARRRRRAAVEEQAARLSVQMVLPLGLCFLPGFILLGVIPVVLGLVEELA
ncbi:secretion system protein [Nesterenkonia sp. AN1]|uniref:type II secretion system F family protein n=1 Tax=Nesterenkonia sp. AN1 TaxID=652017 RepID=UPI00044800A2|nr:type II secretion system F family protein [Nesterenkonia sp. AN1]EXF23962.1 secretion system protein [Nesterenkonia sp. AN1]